MLILACCPLSLSVAFYELSAFLCISPVSFMPFFFFFLKQKKRRQDCFPRNNVEIKCKFLYTDVLEGEEMQANASFSASPNTGPPQTATSTGPPASGAFCISALQKCLLAQATAAHTAALCWLLPCWPATKGEDRWNVDLPQPHFFPFLRIFLFHMYMACRGSIEVGCYLNIAALWASKTAVRQHCWVVTRYAVPSFQNLTCLSFCSVN